MCVCCKGCGRDVWQNPMAKNPTGYCNRCWQYNSPARHNTHQANENHGRKLNPYYIMAHKRTRSE